MARVCEQGQAVLQGAGGGVAEEAHEWMEGHAAEECQFQRFGLLIGENCQQMDSCKLAAPGLRCQVRRQAPQPAPARSQTAAARR